jgi:hypothetical protein
MAMIAFRHDFNQPAEAIEQFAEQASHQVRKLWEQHFGAPFPEGELDNLTTAIWECVWRKACSISRAE